MKRLIEHNQGFKLYYDNHYLEYSVKAPESYGKAEYFTDCWKDAINTMENMINEHNMKNKVVL